MSAAIITIGNFDGVHLGHRRILDRARALADERGGRVIALSFDPHPMTVLRPGRQPPRLMTLDEKTAVLRDAGADEVITLVPRPELLSLDPAAFVEQMVRQYTPLAIVEGPNFHFGKGRAGNVNVLGELGKTFGFETVVVDPVEIALSDQLLVKVSSSIARWLIGHGRVADAARCLGAPYEITGQVITGEQRGRTIGVPTANLDASALGDKLPPCDGVYAGTVTIHDESPRSANESQPSHAAAISIGVKPTFGVASLNIEAHLINYDGDLYDKTITIAFHRWLRDQQKYPSLEVLKAQIGRDIQNTREWAAGNVECQK